MPPDPAPLSYASPLTRHGITIDAGASHLRIVLPPHRVRRIVQQCIAGVVLAFVGIQFLVPVLNGRTPAVINFVVNGGFVVALVIFTLRRVGKPTRVIVDAKTFEVVRPLMPPNGDPKAEPSVMPRGTIYRVYYFGASRAIFVRGSGQQMIEIPCPYGDHVGEEVATAICEWLGLPDESHHDENRQR